MPVPTTVADLDPVAANNYPTGSESVGPNLDDYLRAHAAILKQVSNSIATAIAAALPPGIIAKWAGSVASIPAGWHLCDGTAGTVNLRDKFVLGAGSTYAVGATGGATTVTLNANQMPVHAHGVNDPSHAHNVYDPGHNHGVNDPGHSHPIMGSDTQSLASSGPSHVDGHVANSSAHNTNGSGTGIWLSGSATGIGVYGNTTGISIQNAGSGQAHENMPPYYALCYIQKV